MGNQDRLGNRCDALGDFRQDVGGCVDVLLRRERPEAHATRADRVRADGLVRQRRAVHAGARADTEILLQPVHPSIKTKRG